MWVTSSSRSGYISSVVKDVVFVMVVVARRRARGGSHGKGKGVERQSVLVAC